MNEREVRDDHDHDNHLHLPVNSIGEEGVGKHQQQQYIPATFHNI